MLDVVISLPLSITLAEISSMWQDKLILRSLYIVDNYIITYY